jgi:hypothetical protein
MLRNLAVALLALPAPFAAAQQHWIVDVQGGAGAHFTQIQAALDAVQVAHGDVLHVRGGTYQGFVTSKGVSILGRGAVIDGLVGPTAGAAIVVTNLPAGRTATLVGLQVLHDCSASRIALHLLGNGGTVHLEDVSTQGSGTPTFLFPSCSSVVVERCALVTWNGGSVLGAGGFYVLFSTLALSRVTAEGLRGRDLGIRRISSTPAVLSYGGGTIYLARTDLRGGSGIGAVGPSPALWAIGLYPTDEIVLAGDGTTTIDAGAQLAGAPTPGILLTGHALRYDPAVVIRGSQGGPSIAGTPASARPLAHVASASAVIGGTLHASVYANPGDPVFFAAAAPMPPLPLPVEPLFLDLVTLVPIFVGAQAPSGSTMLGLNVPNDPSLRGIPVALQAAHRDVARGETHLTNPVVVVIE